MLELVHEDPDLVAINKPSGLLVHRGWANDARVAVDLLDTWLMDNPGVRLRLLGVGGSGFSPATQLKLFHNAPSGSELGNTVESIRTRFGDDALVKGGDTAIQRRLR